MPPAPLIKLTRQQARPRPALWLDAARTGPGFALGRAHELTGRARVPLAAMLAGRTDGPVLWIRPDWVVEGLNPDGLSPFFDPARLVIVRPQRPEDVLWAAEEALRAAAAPLVIAEPRSPPALTPVRRLHLAAEAGAGTGRGRSPLCLLLSAGDGGAQGVETRWSMAPETGWARAPAPLGGGAPAWRLTLRRARMAPTRDWRLEWDGQAATLANAPCPQSAPPPVPVTDTATGPRARPA